MGEAVDIYSGADPRTLPIFNRAEVARWIRVPYSTLRRWYSKGDMSFFELYEAGDRRLMHKGGGFEFDLLGEPFAYYPLWPWISVNPRVTFGAPTVAGTGIKARVIAYRVEAGETVAEVAEDYDIDEAAVRAAVKFENREETVPTPGGDHD